MLETWQPMITVIHGRFTEKFVQITILMTNLILNTYISVFLNLEKGLC